MARPDVNFQQQFSEPINIDIGKGFSVAKETQDTAKFITDMNNFIIKQNEQRKKVQRQMEERRREFEQQVTELEREQEIKKQERELKEREREILQRAKKEGTEEGLKAAKEGRPPELPSKDTLLARKKRQQTLNTFTSQMQTDIHTKLTQIAEENEAKPKDFEEKASAYFEGVVSELPSAVEAELRPQFQTTKNQLKRNLSKQFEQQQAISREQAFEQSMETKRRDVEQITHDGEFNEKKLNDLNNVVLNTFNEIAKRGPQRAFKVMGQEYDAGTGSGDLSEEEVRQRMRQFSRFTAMQTVMGQFNAMQTPEQKKQFMKDLRGDIGREKEKEKVKTGVPIELPKSDIKSLLNTMEKSLNTEKNFRDITISQDRDNVQTIVGRFQNINASPSDSNIKQTKRNINRKIKRAKETGQISEFRKLRSMKRRLELNLSQKEYKSKVKGMYASSVKELIRRNNKVLSSDETSDTEKDVAEVRKQILDQRLTALESTKNPVELNMKSDMPKPQTQPPEKPDQSFKAQPINMFRMLSESVSGENVEQNKHRLKRRVKVATASMEFFQRRGQSPEAMAFINEEKEQFESLWSDPTTTAEEKINVLEFFNQTADGLNNKQLQMFQESLSKLGDGEDSFNRVMRTAKRNPTYAKRILRGQELKQTDDTNIPLSKSIFNNAARHVMKNSFTSDMVQNLNATRSSIITAAYEAALHKVSGDNKSDALKKLGLNPNATTGMSPESLFKDKKKFRKHLNKAMGANIGATEKETSGGIYSSEPLGSNVVLPPKVNGEQFDDFVNLLRFGDPDKEAPKTKNTASLREFQRQSNNVTPEMIKEVNSFGTQQQLNAKQLAGALTELGQKTSFEVKKVNQEEAENMIENVRTKFGPAQGMKPTEDIFKKFSANGVAPTDDKGRKFTLSDFQKTFRDDIDFVQASRGKGFYHIELPDGGLLQAGDQFYVMNLNKLANKPVISQSPSESDITPEDATVGLLLPQLFGEE